MFVSYSLTSRGNGFELGGLGGPEQEGQDARCGPMQPPDWRTVNNTDPAGSLINMRAIPNPSAGLVGQPLNGTALQVTADDRGVTRENGYIHVVWEDEAHVVREGWVLEEKLTPIEFPPPADEATLQALAATPIPAGTLESGDTGPAVTQLQQTMVALGYMTADQVTNTYDDTTQAALRQFQMSHEIRPLTGNFGPMTRAVLAQELGMDVPLGTLAQRYESGGDPGSISTGVGDAGGVSYGLYQLTTNGGAAGEFVSWLEEGYPEFHQALSAHEPGSPEFSNAWSTLAATDPAGFAQAQQTYAETHFYAQGQTNVEGALPTLDFDARSQAVRDVLFSVAVQHGPAGAVDIFSQALEGLTPEQLASLSDEELIRRVYDERMDIPEGSTQLEHFSASSSDVQQAVLERMGNERDDALKMLTSERECQDLSNVQ
jgi:peptidoglycan hydrolase-like protein with peptidoglycan-binding domain